MSDIYGMNYAIEAIEDNEYQYAWELDNIIVEWLNSFIKEEIRTKWNHFRADGKWSFSDASDTMWFWMVWGK